jgi:hypothetical protein
MTCILLSIALALGLPKNAACNGGLMDNACAAECNGGWM